MLSRKTVTSVALILFATACADKVTPSGGSVVAPQMPSVQPPLKTLPDPETSTGTPVTKGLQIQVITPENQSAWYEWEPKASRKVPSKTYDLSQFTRTLEKTDLKLRVNASRVASEDTDTKLTLFRAGEEQDAATIGTDNRDATVELSFTTPKLSDEERASGFAKVNYDLFVDTSTGRSHIPFSFIIYDESSPSLVLPKKTGDCFVYHQPERASGCYQNRTRTTQEVVFNDSVTQHHEVDVQFSGGLNIAWSIVTIQLGGSMTVANGTDTSHGSEIHFTNCIECASVIYRQQVDTLKSGDVYQVMADGSVNWTGTTVMKSSAVAYEFASTGSESNNYSCDINSQLPVGSTPSCGSN